ncbi:Dot/Icm system substrate protein SdbA [Legionella busanensis]|uniref:Dot/Icm system substrate protein SdbA n=1 Tax=Legionella busanensis TaxID=190655 RepID=A0A378JLL7_9GAMM|nr:hypothetical protein [Legionella busanensis]STX52115.1 Dot/Icm system substrate protein SdbA [Legionella busanensis]
MHDHIIISSFKKILNLISKQPDSYTSSSLLNQSKNSQILKISRPLCIASSGGSGHISAMMGIIDTLKASNNPVVFPQYQAKLIGRKPKSFKSKLVRLWIHLSSIAGIGYLINKLLHFFGVLELPDEKQFLQEMKKIERNEKDPNNPTQGRQRPYVDFLLDVHPQGYESVAVVNVLHRQERFDDIKWLVKHKNLNTQLYYKEIYNYFFNLLIQAAEQGQAYTEIISTQPTELGLLCDVVIAYNKYINEKNKNRTHLLTPISIHQYLTDLPTTGCEHFLSTLAKLTPNQKAQMHVYAVNFHLPTVWPFIGQDKDFQGIHNIKPHQNPMIRAAFKNKSLINYLDKSQKFNLEIELNSENSSLNQTSNSIIDNIVIPPHAKVASIMLSSVATEASIDYVQELLKNNYDKIFLFGGLQDHIYQKIQAIIASYPPHERDSVASRIVCLGKQNDTNIAPIMVRSNCIVIRGGGLSVMEQMAIPHHPNQVVFIHDAINIDSNKKQNGLSWEDGNTNELIDFLSSLNIFVKRTSPQRFSNDLCLSATKELLIDPNDKPCLEPALSLHDNHASSSSSNIPIIDKAKKFFTLSKSCFNFFSLFSPGAPIKTEMKDAAECASYKIELI